MILSPLEQTLIGSIVTGLVALLAYIRGSKSRVDVGNCEKFRADLLTSCDKRHEVDSRVTQTLLNALVERLDVIESSLQTRLGTMEKTLTMLLERSLK